MIIQVFHPASFPTIITGNSFPYLLNADQMLGPPCMVFLLPGMHFLAPYIGSFLFFSSLLKLILKDCEHDLLFELVPLQNHFSFPCFLSTSFITVNEM